MGMPYQCLMSCGRVLLAARGSSIDSFNIEDGSLLSTWNLSSAQNPKTSKQPNENTSASLQTSRVDTSAEDVLESSPPTKRRKVSIDDNNAQTLNSPNRPKKEVIAAQKWNKRSEAVVSGLATPAVIALKATADGLHVIAVTGEDKSIRVFENGVDGEGKHCLRQLSQRAMPKRPCTIAVTADNLTIISADKFGDVYSLPLLFSETSASETLKTITPTIEPKSSQPFVSAANHLTVHSQRNRKALENQQSQSNKPPERTEPTFEHQLLLGHVSMLTDLALLTSSEGRNYILTADRDEHIRVSRGIPQAHIIEGFCLGHTEFISRLCIPKERPEILISGGGDDGIFAWNWMTGSVIGKGNLRCHIRLLLEEARGQDLDEGTTELFKVAVSSITHVRLAGGDGIEDLIVVGCEGVPALFSFLLNSKDDFEYIQTFKLPGNVLDVVVTAAGGLGLSLDTIHKPASITERRDLSAQKVNPLQSFVFKHRMLVPSMITFQIAEGEVQERSQSKNLFYNLEQLRKWDDGKEEE